MSGWIVEEIVRGDGSGIPVTDLILGWLRPEKDVGMKYEEFARGEFTTYHLRTR